MLCLLWTITQYIWVIFNARNPALGGCSNTIIKFMQHKHLTRWDAGGATYSRGGTPLDHIPMNLWHLSLQYQIPTVQSSPYQRTCIIIPPKYYPNCISYMSSLFFKLDVNSPEKLYSSLVSFTYDFYSHLFYPRCLHQLAGEEAYQLFGNDECFWQGSKGMLLGPTQFTLL